MILRLMSKLFPKAEQMTANFLHLAKSYGQWRSIKEQKAVDVNGEPLPWYTYPAIEYFRSFSLSECDVFEYGAGNSSTFWAQRARTVISVESDAEWFKYVNRMAKDNQVVIHRGLEEGYINSLPEQDRLFHIVVIDGQWRSRCAREAVKYLQTGGIIVLDNSDRDIEKECSKFIREQGFFQIDFSGFGPINAYCWTTSIFLNAPTTLQQNFVGPSPIGGLKK